MQIGTFLGYLMFGYIADRFNRKYTYIGYLLMAALLVPMFAFVRSPNYLLMIGPLVGFFGTGYFSGFSAISSELFPTSLRGTAMGFSYNVGRVVSAAAPYLIGAAGATGGPELRPVHYLGGIRAGGGNRYVSKAGYRFTDVSRYRLELAGDGAIPLPERCAGMIGFSSTSISSWRYIMAVGWQVSRGSKEAVKWL